MRVLLSGVGGCSERPVAVRSGLRFKVIYGVMEGIDTSNWTLDEDGHLANSADWSPAFAEFVSTQRGFALTADHWWLIGWVREYHLKYRNPPLMRTTVQALREHKQDPSLGSQALYRLFEDHPIREACRLGGVPKPDWCI